MRVSETIVVVRTHLACGHVRDLAAALHVPGEYRVVIAVDESAGSIDAAPWDQVALSRERVAGMGLFAEADDIFWRAGDYALYCAQARYPDAARFWLVEYDVAINRADPVSFLREIDAASDHDLLAPHFREPEPWWFYADHLRGVYPTIMRCFYPVIRLSARAVRHAYAERVRLSGVRRETPEHARLPWPNDEVFTASSLASGGFRCADLATLGHHYTQDTVWGTPMRHPKLLPPHDGMLYHPVRDGAPFLAAMRRGDTFEPPLDPASVLALYPELDADGRSELKRLVLAVTLRGTPDDPARLFGPGAAARRLLAASPDPDSMRAVIQALARGRKPLCLAWLRRHREFEGWPHLGELENLALGRAADQSSVSPWSAAPEARRDAEGGNDGRLDVDFGFHTGFEAESFWGVDLGGPVRLAGAWIFNRRAHWERLRGFEILVSEDGESWTTAHRSAPDDVPPGGGAPVRVGLAGRARYLRIRVRDTALHLREVMVFGAAD